VGGHETTAAGVAKLHRALPSCQIEWDEEGMTNDEVRMTKEVRMSKHEHACSSLIRHSNFVTQ
jgi:hypothetical protein